MRISNCLISGLIVCCSSVTLKAQNYSAIHGSDYSGALGVYNNPSSVVSSPYKWDLTIFGTQFTTVTNAVQGRNFPLYFSPGARLVAANGNFSREADISSNIHLLNGRFAIDQNHAFGFGLNFRTYFQGSTSPVNYNNSVQGPRTFLTLNEPNKQISMDLASSAWMELYGTYGFTFRENETSRLNVGATLRILRSMSGAYVNAKNIGIERVPDSDPELYRIVGGSAKYGISANHGDGSSFTVSDLFSKSQTNFSIDLGAEYVIKSQAVSSVYDEPAGTEYDWKIGVSLLDLGYNKFLHGRESRFVSTLKTDISNEVLQEKFTSVKSIGQFNDSLLTIVERSDMLAGTFYIINPARAVVNVDRYLYGNLYVNGELSIGLVPKGAQGNTAIKEMKLVTITPRWENRKFGLFFPFQYTRLGNFWIGGALKAGPVLLGTHNLLNAFSKNKGLSGGAYLAITIRPSDLLKSKDPRNRQYECPEY